MLVDFLDISMNVRSDAGIKYAGTWPLGGGSIGPVSVEWLLRATDGRVRVWRQDMSGFAPKHVQATLQCGGASVTVRGCVSYGCKLDLVSVQGTLTGVIYRIDILNPIVAPHFDNHSIKIDLCTCMTTLDLTEQGYSGVSSAGHRNSTTMASLQSGYQPH